jgi:hypothetical protein
LPLFVQAIFDTIYSLLDTGIANVSASTSPKK